MKHGYRTLVHEKLTPGTGISRSVRPVPIVTLDAPALDVMTDLEKEKAITIGPTASMDTANRLMMASGVRLLLVTEPLDRVLGLITATDILGEKPMQVLGKTPGRAYSEIDVQSIMSPAEEIEVLAFDAVRTARVGDVVATLREAGRLHALVAHSGSAATPVIRGIFSATQISKQLGIRVDTTQPAKTFAELEAILVASSHKLSHPQPRV